MITSGHIYVGVITSEKTLHENFVPTQFIHGESTGQGPRAPKAHLNPLYTQYILEPLIRIAPPL